MDHLFRRQAGQMVATLTRILGFGHLDLAEDAVQEAFVAALRKWPFHGVPEDPGAWIFTVARRRAIDRLRRRGILRHKEGEIRAALRPPGSEPGRQATYADELRDDELRLIFACCHPSLSRADQVALTLKTAGGFSVPEIARGFLARPAAMAQRLVRAKRRLRESGARLEIPGPEALAARRDAALEVAYLMFTEGHEATSGQALARVDLCHEALRLAELLASHPQTEHPRADALAALLCFHAARLPTRADAAGDVWLLADQDRTLWHRPLIARGLRHLRRSARGEELTSYHLQAEIASCHALAATWADTDWEQILDCYDRLYQMQPSPVVAINRLVARSEVEGPEVALAELATLPNRLALERYLPAWVTRAELLRQTGDETGALAAYDRALALGPSDPLRRRLSRRRADLSPPSR